MQTIRIHTTQFRSQIQNTKVHAFIYLIYRRNSRTKRVNFPSNKDQKQRKSKRIERNQQGQHLQSMIFLVNIFARIWIWIWSRMKMIDQSLALFFTILLFHYYKKKATSYVLARGRKDLESGWEESKNQSVLAGIWHPKGPFYPSVLRVAGNARRR